LFYLDVCDNVFCFKLTVSAYFVPFQTSSSSFSSSTGRAPGGDPRAQEQAVWCLMNLAIDSAGHKMDIVQSGAMGRIFDVSSW
jgi:hypothetical protein